VIKISATSGDRAETLHACGSEVLVPSDSLVCFRLPLIYTLAGQPLRLSGAFTLALRQGWLTFAGEVR